MNWKIKLEKRWGQSLQFGFQCNDLSQDIFRVTKAYISPQTLRRICGFVKTNSSISESSKQIITQYLGKDNLNNHLLLTEADTQFIIPFIQDFFQIPLSSFEDFNYQNACAKIAQRLFEKPALLEHLGPFLAKNPTAQLYFFERLPFLDGLASPYMHYLEMYAQEKQELPSSFFAQALNAYGKKLSMKDWLPLPLNQFLKEGKKNQHWHPFLKGRIKVLRIWDAIQRESWDDLNHCLSQAVLEQQQIFQSTKNKGYFPYYEWILAEGLHLAERYADSQYFANLYIQLKKTNTPFPIEPGYHEAIKVIQFRNAQILGDQRLFTKLKKEIEIKNVIFLGQRYFRIIYNLALLQASYLHTKRKKQIQDQLDEDIAQTGYVYFNQFRTLTTTSFLRFTN